MRDFPDKSSDAYRVDQARKLIDEEDFDGAISVIKPVLDRSPTNAEVAYVSAAAYAGRAGLRIVDLFLTIAQDLSTKTLFRMLAEAFPGSDDDDIADIEAAIAAVEGAGSRAVDRGADLNFFALFVYYARIGIVLNRYAYDSNNSLRSNFTACTSVVNASASETGIAHEAVDKVMTAIPRVLDAMGGVSGSGGAYDLILDSSLFPGGLGFTPIPCSASNSTAPTDSCVVIRSLINVDGAGKPGLGTGFSGIPVPDPGGVCAAAR